MQPFIREPEFLTQLKDGTVKQLNPFSGTEVWTVAGRGNRPLGVSLPDPVPLDPAQHGRHCAFCDGRKLETPPGTKQQAAALMDLRDVDSADCVIFMAEPYGSENRGGGRYFEYGYAFAMQKHIIVIQPGGYHVPQQ